jgi:hypothetical protein
MRLAIQAIAKAAARLTYSSGNTTVADVNSASGAVTIKAAGSALITATKAGNDDWETATASYTLTVNRKTLTWSAQASNTVDNKTYNRSTAAAVRNAPTPVGIVGTDTVPIVTGQVNFNSMNVGTGIGVTATNWGINASATNYNAPIAQPLFANANITAKSLTWGAAGTVASKVYNRSTAATVNTQPGLVGVENGDTVTVTGGTVAFGNMNVGTTINITIGGTWGIGGANAGNYTAPSGNPNFSPGTITAKPLTWNAAIPGTAQARGFIPGNTTATVATAPGLTGVEAGDTVTASQGTATVTFNSADAGTRAVTSTAGWTITGASAGNYTAPSGAPTFSNGTINRINATPAPSAPTASTVGETSITLNAITNTVGQTVHYARNTSDVAPSTGWGTSRDFTGLTAGTEYYFFARFVQSTNYNEQTSSGTMIKTASPEFAALYEGNGTSGTKLKPYADAAALQSAFATDVVGTTVTSGARTLQLNGDITLAAVQTIAAGVELTIVGGGSEAKIMRTHGTGHSFNVNGAGAALTLGNNITLQGRTNSGGTNINIVQVTNGSFTMQNGSKITGNENMMGAAVSVTGATASFTMNSGATITGNKNTMDMNGASGVNITNGSFTMNGGSITGNTGVYNSANVDADVYVARAANNPTFTLSGAANIGTLILNAATQGSPVIAASSYTGIITRLHLSSGSTLADTQSWWGNKQIITGSSAGNITMLNNARGQFRGSDGVANITFEISGTGVLVAPTITISGHPVATTNVVQYEITGSLSVTATVTPTGTPTYQWYSNTANNNTSGTIINGATNTSYTIPTNLTGGTYYYYCIVSSPGAASVTSSVASVIVAPVFDVTSEADLRAVGRGVAAGAQYEGWTLSARYRQTVDIVLTGAANSTQIVGSFTGRYDGNYKTISGLSFSAGGTDARHGLFVTIGVGGVVRNLGVININFTNSGTLIGSGGGIAGINNGTIENCYTTGTISGSIGSSFGGIAGAGNGTIRNCYSTVNITINNNTLTNARGIGGIIGYMTTGGTVQNCYATGNITGAQRVGGIAGEAANIRNSVALNKQIVQGSTTVDDSFGRITGLIASGTQSNNHARDTMTVVGSTVTTGAQNNKDGANVIQSNYVNQTWWASTASWSFLADSPWVWNSTANLPVLRGFAYGTSNPLPAVTP